MLKVHSKTESVSRLSLRSILKGYRGRLFFGVIFSLLNAAITLGLLSYVNTIVNDGPGPNHGVALLIGVSWMLALLLVSIASQVFLSRFGGELVAEMRMELSYKFLNMDFEKLANKRHVVFGALIEDIGRIAPLILAAPQLVYQVLLIALYCGYMAYLSPLLFGVFVSFLVVTMIVTIAFSSLVDRRYDALRRAEDGVFESFRAIGEGKKEMTMSRRRARHFMTHVLSPAVVDARGAMVRAYRAVGFNNAWALTATYAAVFAIAYAGYVAFDLATASITRFVLVALFLAGPIGALVQASQLMAGGMASLRHLSSVGLMDGAAPGMAANDESDNPPSSIPWRAIHAVGIRYKYPEGEGYSYGIGPIDLTIERGQTVFLTGGNGSGKSTLLLLLCGLLRPTSGEFMLDDQPVHADIGAYRSRFAGVFADFFLFRHVLDGRGDAFPDSSVDELLGTLELRGKVTSERGAFDKLSLSTGERKRLALLHCWAEDKEICFFDEWAAEQDPYFRERFYRELLPQLKRQGKTLIVVSHDDRYFHLADRILKMEGGVLVSDTPGYASGGAVVAEQENANV